jgi:chromosome segregation protein
MYLKSIDLYGFKSFANKMIFKFDKGITGIVGPNGSGKSNVADAVRWVLGEQSAKQLRGSKMEDVIFAGTETRRPLGYCQVDLTIDNIDGKMPIEYREVTVSRRVYRSGESAYYINGTACRLKDVHELFMDTGVGREGYSIIGQGQVDKILSSKPNDRRDLFDEAAGIVKYKTRKMAATKKLESSETDLERITDIIGELEIQKDGLEGQAETARVYLDFREELKKLEVNSFIRLIDDFEMKLKELKEKEGLVQNEYEEKKTFHKDLQQKYHEYEEQFKVIEEELDEYREHITSTSLAIEKLQSTISLSEEKKKNSTIQIEKLKNEIQHLEDTEMRRRIELNEMKDLKEKHSEKLISGEKIIAEHQEVLENIQQEIATYEQEIDSIQTDMIQRLNEGSNIKGQVHRNEVMIENNSSRLEQLSSRKVIVLQTVQTLENELKNAQSTLDNFENNQQKLLDQKLTIRSRIGQKEKKLAEEKKSTQEIVHELNKNKSKLEAIKDMEEQYDGYYYSVKKVMELNDPGALGVVAELIHVDNKYTRAIELALGSGLQNIVTLNEQKAKSFIDYLKKNKFGRGTFLPLNNVHGQCINSFKKTKGFINIASELVDCDEKYCPIIRHLLGRILVVDNIDNGIQLARENQQKVRIITLDGEVINPGGAMSGGAFKNEKGQLLSRKNDIEYLISEIKHEEQEVQKLHKAIHEAEEELTRLKNEIEEIQNQEQSMNIEHHTMLTQINTNQVEYNKYHQELKNISAEVEELKRETAHLLEEKNSLSKQLNSSQTDHVDAESRVEFLNEKIQVLKEDLKIIMEDLTNDKMAFTSLQEQMRHYEENIRRLSEGLADHTKSIEKLRIDIQAHELSCLKETQNLQKSQAEQIKEREKLVDLNAKVNDLKYKRQDIQVQKGQMDSKRELAYEQANQLEKELIRIGGNIERNELQKETQINYMWDEYELTYTKALEFKTDIELAESTIKSKISSIKSEMKQLGDVNVHAIEEYRQVKERYTFLTSQREDLMNAKEKLLKIIHDLDEQMTLQFREKFNEINAKFNSVFKELFGGGTGFLELTDDEDVLSAGITIIAQPPGKKLQNMMLLSGGERAFTAIALLFAIQSLRPSPFCVLDEIEAALDDANVDRFAAYLQKLTDQTQFIVITHRKGTMEAANALYGITMQEKGVSTQVSVKLIQDQLDQTTKE